MNGSKIHLPPLEACWAWPRRVSPYLGEVEQECLEWSASFGAFDPKTQRLIHDYGKLKYVRSGCDLMHLFFMFDEHSDQATPDEVWRQAGIQMDALCYPHKARPPGEWVGGEFTRQFWLRLPKTATKTFRRRFLGTWIDYVESVAEQAEHRSKARILDLETYFPLRRNTSGAPSTIALYEIDMDIPDDVRNHPILRRLETLAVDLIVIANDLLSYNKEQAVGDDEHNVVTIIMEQYHMDVQQAVDKAGELSQEMMEHFHALYRQVPRWGGPVDLDVQRLVDGMAQCVSGVLHWSYESQRYFGTQGLVIKRTRTLRLLPKYQSNSGGVAVKALR
ncbi:isoprenoid synthase domain-containing protein [Chaetomidium leptoderma]|uniref:Terpene synthase n=1 Tax=Chaetomidium leptoderma TaxID=669021 RepID=A0AAN6VSR1_9PEZI|nr:isoprenoid synthase domain-containing protein [Chaetomidium leptoderma]